MQTVPSQQRNPASDCSYVQEDPAGRQQTRSTASHRRPPGPGQQSASVPHADRSSAQHVKSAVPVLAHSQWVPAQQCSGPAQWTPGPPHWHAPPVQRPVQHSSGRSHVVVGGAQHVSRSHSVPVAQR